MADTTTGTDNGEAQVPALRVLTQYIKDLSFENPTAPMGLRSNLAAPQINLSIDVQARRLDDGNFEIELNIEAKADRDGSVVFLAELKYAGVFQLVNIPADQIEPLLLIECPRMLFPFARRILAEVTRDGAFPPLYVDPIDFAGLYQQQKMRAQAAGESPAATDA